MLKQSLNSQESPAAEMRVKKEEFARAIAALEARRQAEAQQREGTVVIGDVLQQLQINLPAEEVMQEIEAIQAGQPQEAIVRRPLWNAEQAADAKLITGIVLVPLIAIAITALFTPLRQSAASPKPSFTGQPPGSYRLWTPPPPNLPSGVTAEVMDESGFNASSVLKPLSSVPDNQPVHCTTASLQRLFSSGYPTPVLLDPTALAQSSQPFDVRPNLHKPWTLIKHKGQLYVRGWVTAKFTEAQAQGRLVTLHSAPSSFEPGVQPVPITLLAKFRPYFSGNMPYFSGNMGFERQPATLQVEGASPAPPTWENLQRMGVPPSKITLDQHAWEKW
jgi:hypothetical protein